MSKKLRVGDYFGLELAGGKFIVGRITFDPEQRKAKEGNYGNFNFVQDCYVIQVYEGIYSRIDSRDLAHLKVLIPGLYIFKSSFYKKLYKPAWRYLDHREVNPRTVEFPMVITNAERFYFEYGEISIPIEKGVDIRKTVHATNSQAVVNALHYMGRDDLVRKDYFMPASFLERSDLRFSEDPVLHDVAAMVGVDLGKGYYQLALEHGADLSRLYE
tara:strand:- start:10621 stop:11265 length:645 start_codon:yes stop_codon:yes gene_type:complete